MTQSKLTSPQLPAPRKRQNRCASASFWASIMHAESLRLVRQRDGAGTQPPQRLSPGADLERFVKKQRTLAQQVYAVYEAGPCGFGLARQLTAWGITCFVIRPMKLDTLGKRVNTDKTDAAELAAVT